MVEKFDDSRFWFKRKVENRSRDQHLEIDAYRTEVGLGQGKLAAAIVAGILVIIGLALTLVFISQP